MKFRLIYIVVIFLFLVNCAYMSASTIDDYKKAKHQHDSVKIEASKLDEQYVQYSKESIIQILGKPSQKIHKAYPFTLDKNCRNDGCPLGQADEVWIYQFSSRTEQGISSYEIWVYIKDNLIVRINGG